jgi:hypothetical protein
MRVPSAHLGAHDPKPAGFARNFPAIKIRVGCRKPLALSKEIGATHFGYSLDAADGLRRAYRPARVRTHGYFRAGFACSLLNTEFLPRAAMITRDAYVAPPTNRPIHQISWPRRVAPFPRTKGNTPERNCTSAPIDPRILCGRGKGEVVNPIIALTVDQWAYTQGSTTQDGSTADCLRYIDRVQVLILERPDLAKPLLRDIRRLTATLRHL